MSAARYVNGLHEPSVVTPPSPPSAPPVSPSVRAERRAKELTPEALAAGLYAKRGELRGLARRHGMTLDELARRTSEPDAARSIGALRRLAEARAGVLLARARADATTLLLALAESAESDETRRRACVDLLKAPSVAQGEPEHAQQDHPPLDPGAGASLLAMLERLGERDRAEGA